MRQYAAVLRPILSLDRIFKRELESKPVPLQDNGTKIGWKIL